MRAREMMTGGPRACRPDEPGSLVGIVAQADLAVQLEDDALVAGYLREVSAAPPVEPAPER